MFQPGTILAFSGDGWISTGIRWRTWSEWSHVGLVVDIQRRDVDALTFSWGDGISGDRLAWLSANPPGTVLLESTMLAMGGCLVTGRPIEGVQCQYPGNRVETYAGRVASLQPRIALSETDRAILARYALTHVGRPYDTLGAALIGSYGWKYLRAMQLADRSSFFCSELVADALRLIADTSHPDGPKPGWASPARVVEWHGRWTHEQPKWET